MSIRPLFASVANSKRVMTEIAKPPAFLRSSSIAARAFHDNLGGVRRNPEHNLRVEQNHARLLHSRSGNAGETTSPVILIFLRRKPKISSSCGSTGTRFWETG
jgi:hypothetical protein